MSEADQHLRNIAEALGKFLPEIAAETKDTGLKTENAITDVGAQIIGVQESINELANAVRDLTALVGEMQVFPRQSWAKTRCVIGWFRQ